MAAMSAAPTSTTTLTPPSSSHGSSYPWNMAPASHTENPPQDSKMSGSDDRLNGRTPLSSQSGNTPPLEYPNAGKVGTLARPTAGDMAAAASDAKMRSAETGYLSPPYTKDIRPRGIQETTSPADSLLDLYGNGSSDIRTESHKRGAADTSGGDPEDESSKWIHRDKLARIENAELQAAGIFLPRAALTRTKSLPRLRKDQSQEKATVLTREPVMAPASRSRKNSEIAGAEPKTPEHKKVPSWDLRMPEEVLAEANGHWFINGSGAKGASRIPVAKISPVPIPAEHLARDTPMVRRRDDSPGQEDKIVYSKTRARSRSNSLGNILPTSASGAANGIAKPRSATDTSPKKVGGPRKMSAPGAVKTASGGAGTTGRPKTRGGPSNQSSSGGSGTRPSSRSAELSLSPSKSAPEGDPPWMVSAYVPDPRLPPDQQLLPTVARRLQQEKWEREGKFGSVYDKDFRPLNDEGFPTPPEPSSPAKVPEKGENEKQPQHQAEDWPLRSPTTGRPMLPSNTGSYTTMPKITDKSPLASPRLPKLEAEIPRLPADPPEDGKKKGGCACCIVM